MSTYLYMYKVHQKIKYYFNKILSYYSKNKIYLYFKFINGICFKKISFDYNLKNNVFFL